MTKMYQEWESDLADTVEAYEQELNRLLAECNENRDGAQQMVCTSVIPDSFDDGTEGEYDDEYHQVRAEMAEIFEMLDTNVDNKISREEFSEVLYGDEEREQQWWALYEEYDQDGDVDSLTWDEMWTIAVDQMGW